LGVRKGKKASRAKRGGVVGRNSEGGRVEKKLIERERKKTLHAKGGKEETREGNPAIEVAGGNPNLLGNVQGEKGKNEEHQGSGEREKKKKFLLIKGWANGKKFKEILELQGVRKSGGGTNHNDKSLRGIHKATKEVIKWDTSVGGGTPGVE